MFSVLSSVRSTYVDHNNHYVDLDKLALAFEVVAVAVVAVVVGQNLKYYYAYLNNVLDVHN